MNEAKASDQAKEYLPTMWQPDGSGPARSWALCKPPVTRMDITVN